jgi:hypothetical protein
MFAGRNGRSASAAQVDPGIRGVLTRNMVLSGLKTLLETGEPRAG